MFRLVLSPIIRSAYNCIYNIWYLSHRYCYMPIITGITFVFTFHMHCIYIVWSLYFRIFSASFLITFLSPGIATSINIHVLFSLSRIIMSGLLLGMVLSVWTCWFHSMVKLPPPRPVSTDFGTCLLLLLLLLLLWHYASRRTVAST
jgi:hypothetical protein